MVFAPAFDQRTIGVKWASGRDVLFLSMNYTSSASGPALSVAVNGVGSFSVKDDRKKIGPEGTFVDVTLGSVTKEMWSKLYAWSYSPIVKPFTDGNGFTGDSTRNLVVLNWELIRRRTNMSVVNVVFNASASPVEHVLPPVITYDIGEIGWFVAGTSGPVNSYYMGTTTILDDFDYIGPTFPSFNSFEDALAFISGAPEQFVIMWPIDVPEIKVWDEYSFGVEIMARRKTTDVRVTTDGNQYFIAADAPDFTGFFGSEGSGNKTSGHGEGMANWTVTGIVQSNLLDGTLTLNPDNV